jgi:hypothetical protein
MRKFLGQLSTSLLGWFRRHRHFGRLLIAVGTTFALTTSGHRIANAPSIKALEPNFFFLFRASRSDTSDVVIVRIDRYGQWDDDPPFYYHRRDEMAKLLEHMLDYRDGVVHVLIAGIGIDSDFSPKWSLSDTEYRLTVSEMNGFVTEGRSPELAGIRINRMLFQNEKDTRFLNDAEWHEEVVQLSEAMMKAWGDHRNRIFLGIGRSLITGGSPISLQSWQPVDDMAVGLAAKADQIGYLPTRLRNEITGKEYETLPYSLSALKVQGDGNAFGERDLGAHALGPSVSITRTYYFGPSTREIIEYDAEQVMKMTPEELRRNFGGKLVIFGDIDRKSFQDVQYIPGKGIDRGVRWMARATDSMTQGFRFLEGWMGFLVEVGFAYLAIYVLLLPIGLGQLVWKKVYGSPFPEKKYRHSSWTPILNGVLRVLYAALVWKVCMLVAYYFRIVWAEMFWFVVLHLVTVNPLVALAEKMADGLDEYSPYPRTDWRKAVTLGVLIWWYGLLYDLRRLS